MKAPRRTLLWTIFLLASATALAWGCRSIVEPQTSNVIVEGVVVEGHTFRVDPLKVDLDGWKGPGLPARIRLENQRGQHVEVDADAEGRFRIGPLALSGQDRDRLIISCPGTLGLQMSYLLPPEAKQEPASKTVVVRRKITLPHRTDCARPVGQPASDAG